ncbi:hypothetical protein CK203_089427 [Vitis vinifera]|uniref:Uncharacterized protein n=1 Tax=Vitis vinifera TaxID=29760 RepID=A0A438E957_VITVI|nr:hypothetical protein CK203_089427 [Vitis vinifera]
MCGGDFMSKNPEETMDFLSYVAEAGMYTLKEDDDMKAKLAAVTRGLEELELKKVHEVQAVAKTPMQPNNNAPYGKYLTTQVGGIIQISHGRPEQLNTNSRNQPSQQSSSLEQAIANLSKGRFPSQPHQNPEGVHEVEVQEGESSQMKDVKALITLRSGKKIEKPTPKPHVEKEEEIKKGDGMENKEKEISEKNKDSNSTMNTIPEKELLKEEMLKKSTSPPFPQALHGKKGIRNASEILERLIVNKKTFLTEQVSAILQCKSPLKYKDLEVLTISVMIGGKVVEKALLDLGASVNLLPYSIYKQLRKRFWHTCATSQHSDTQFAAAKRIANPQNPRRAISGAASRALGASAATSEPQNPSEIAPEVVIRRSMLTQPPIEGNLDCRARYHMEQLLAPRDFFYPRIAMDFYQSMTTKQVRDPTLIHFTIDGRHGILGARHIAEALHIPYEPTHFEDFRVWTSPTELEMRRGVLLEALFKISEGYFFNPHHLIMVALLYFEEKVHKKKLQRADVIPLLFPRLLCQILEHLGVEQPERPQPAARRASPRHIPEGILIAAPAIPRAPPVTPASSKSSTSAEPRMVIPISEYRELCCALQTLTASQSSLAQEMAAIRACQEQMLATQAQHTTILRQLQHHFDLPSAAEPSTSTTVVPHSHPTEPQAPSGAATKEADPSA